MLLKSEEMYAFFDKRGYPASVVQAGHHRARLINRPSALQTSQKELSDFLVRSALQRSDQPGTFKWARTRSKTCAFIRNVEKISRPKRIKAHLLSLLQLLIGLCKLQNVEHLRKSSESVTDWSYGCVTCDT